MNDFATRLQETIDEEHLTQVELAKRCSQYETIYATNITKQEICMWLSKRQEPGVKKILLLAHALHVNPAWLMGFNAPKFDPWTMGNGREEERQELHRLVDHLTFQDVMLMLPMARQLVERK